MSGCRLPCGCGLCVGPALPGPMPRRRPLYKAPFPMDRHIRGICPRFALDPSWGRGLLGAVGGDRAWLASRWSPASVALVGTLLPLIKRQLKVFASSLAWASSGEDVSRLLAQLTPRSKSASLAGCRGDPWDVSRQMALPLAYPYSHPHDTACPMGCTLREGLWTHLSCTALRSSPASRGTGAGGSLAAQSRSSSLERVEPGKMDPGNWVAYLDGAHSREGLGAGMLLVSPTGEHLKYIVELA
jgi:hypothetical protein